jgi:hypothetical protein
MSLVPLVAVRSKSALALGSAFVLALGALQSPARAQCPDIGPFQYWTGAGSTAVPGFVSGEEWGAVFNNIPPGDYPIEVLRVGFGWGSLFGGQPDTLENSVNIYAGGLPNPGAPIASLPGPVLSDGFINEFDLEPLPGQIIVNSGPVTATISIANSQGLLDPAPVHDGNGCQSGRNVIFASPGGWSNACSLGVSGDWLVHLVYRKVNCGGATAIAYCFGDGTGSACPCDPGQAGGPGEGCMNSFGTGGLFTATGTPSVANDSVVLHTVGLPPTSSVLYFQGTIKQNNGLGSPLNDGLLCVNGAILRLGSRVLTNGTNDFGFGIGGDPLISAAGQIPAGGGQRFYQAWYRNTDPSWCPPGTSNLSNALDMTWVP